MKHALFAAALLTLALTACGQKDAAVAKPETPSVAAPAPEPAPAPAATSETAPVDAAAPVAPDAAKPATGAEADLKQH